MGDRFKTRDSAPPFPVARPMPQAKKDFAPAGVELRMSPVVPIPVSATKRLPVLSQASPLGLFVRPVAKTVLVPSGANLRMPPLPFGSTDVAKKFPKLSKARPVGP